MEEAARCVREAGRGREGKREENTGKMEEAGSVVCKRDSERGEGRKRGEYRYYSGSR